MRGQIIGFDRFYIARFGESNGKCGGKEMMTRDWVEAFLWEMGLNNVDEYAALRHEQAREARQKRRQRGK